MRCKLFFREWPLPAGTFDIVARDGAGAQQHGHAARAVHDGRFNAHLAGTAIQHQQLITKFRSNVCCGGGAHTAKLVGAGGGYAPDGRVQLLAGLEHGMRHGVRWAAQAHAVLTARRCLGSMRQAWQDQGEGAGPERVDQLLGKDRHFLGIAGDGVSVGHMHDQRMVGRAPLGGKDLRHGCVVVAVGSQAIDRFGGQAQQLALLQGHSSGLYRGVQLSIQYHVISLERRTQPLMHRCFALSYFCTACGFTPRLKRKSTICWAVLAALKTLQCPKFQPP